MAWKSTFFVAVLALAFILLHVPAHGRPIGEEPIIDDEVDNDADFSVEGLKRLENPDLLAHGLTVDDEPIIDDEVDDDEGFSVEGLKRLENFDLPVHERSVDKEPIIDDDDEDEDFGVEELKRLENPDLPVHGWSVDEEPIIDDEVDEEPIIDDEVDDDEDDEDEDGDDEDGDDEDDDDEDPSVEELKRLENLDLLHGRSVDDDEPVIDDEVDDDTDFSVEELKRLESLDLTEIYQLAARQGAANVTSVYEKRDGGDEVEGVIEGELDRCGFVRIPVFGGVHFFSVAIERDYKYDRSDCGAGFLDNFRGECKQTVHRWGCDRLDYLFYATSRALPPATIWMRFAVKDNCGGGQIEEAIRKATTGEVDLSCYGASDTAALPIAHSYEELRAQEGDAHM